MASAPVAQALATQWTPALAPSSSPTTRGRAVGHEHRHGVRRDPAGPARLEDVVLGEQGLRPADAGADADRESLRVQPVAVGQAGVGPGLLGGDQRDAPRTGRAGAA